MEREVGVWFVELAAEAEAVETCRRSLSADESERADRFRFEHLRTSFVIAHGTLRFLLGRYLGIEPERIRFRYGPRGKPALAFPDTSLRFNMAHSGGLAAYAFTADREVGIDVEEMRPMTEREGIVRRFFSAEECAEWLDLEPALRDEAFYRCWTRKEAYIKAIGDGLSMPLDRFRVSLRPGVPAALLGAVDDRGAADRWRMWNLDPAPGYAGALAIEDPARVLRVMPRCACSALADFDRHSIDTVPAEAFQIFR